MNRSKKLYILLGILVVACAATSAVMQMEERKEQIKETGEIILELPSESVQSLSWEYDGETLAFHKNETWLYDEDENFPVSEEKIHDLLEQFQAFGAAFIIEDAENFGQYGLDNPICTIHLSTEDQTYEVKLGNYSKMDSQRYVSIGDGNVYLVKHDPLSEYDAVLSDLIDHDEIPSFDRVTRVQFEGAESCTITYQEDSADGRSAGDVCFARQGGRNLPADPSKVDSYLKSLTALNPVDYVSYSVTEEELQRYGLDAPELTVTVDFTAEGEDGTERADSFVLYVSPDPEEAAENGGDDGQEAEISAYIRVGDSGIVYRISPDSYRRIAAVSYDDFRHREVVWADFSDVQSLTIFLEGVSYTITSEEDGGDQVWRYQGEEIDMTGLIDSLKALTASEFTSERAAGREEIRLTLSLRGEDSPSLSAALYRRDGSLCLAAVDGESVSLVDRRAVVDLIEAVHAIVLNEGSAD